MEKPKLESWSYDGVYLYGRVFNHPNSEKNPDGTWVRTSCVEKIDDTRKWAKTRNTEYELGKPHK